MLAQFKKRSVISSMADSLVRCLLIDQVGGEPLEEDFVSPLAGDLQILGSVAVLAKAVLDEHPHAGWRWWEHAYRICGYTVGMTATERLMDGSIAVDLVTRLENEKALDPVVSKVGEVVNRVIAPPAARSFLQGQWLGHAIHPALTDLPLGLFTATNVLDLLPVPGSRQSAQRLLALGLASAPAAAVTGWAEWSGARTRERRVGLVHAALNVSGLVLYGLSLRSRRRDRHGSGVALALGGSVASAAAGYLGGHLVTVRKVSSRNPGFDNPGANSEANLI
jgi:uncharacterized membrane protein